MRKEEDIKKQKMSLGAKIRQYVHMGAWPVTLLLLLVAIGACVSLSMTWAYYNRCSSFHEEIRTRIATADEEYAQHQAALDGMTESLQDLQVRHDRTQKQLQKKEKALAEAKAKRDELKHKTTPEVYTQTEAEIKRLQEEVNQLSSQYHELLQQYQY